MSWDVLGRGLGGEGGIRTPGTLASTFDFETGVLSIVINHLADGWLLFALVGIVFVSRLSMGPPVVSCGSESRARYRCPDQRNSFKHGGCR